MTNITVRQGSGPIDQSVISELFGKDPQVIIGIDQWGGYLIAGDLRVGFVSSRRQGEGEMAFVYNAALDSVVPDPWPSFSVFYQHDLAPPEIGAGYFIRLAGLSPRQVAKIEQELRAAFVPEETENFSYALEAAVGRLQASSGIRLACGSDDCVGEYGFLKRVLTGGFIAADGTPVQIQHYVVNQPGLRGIYTRARNQEFVKSAVLGTAATAILVSIGVVGQLIAYALVP